MRNIFDQYDQPENRLTHALVSCLAEDRRLLRRFIRWTTNGKHPNLKRLEILEQGLPGEQERYTEDEVEQRGLPDAWIHDGDRWSLIIESKVAAGLSRDQLRRHHKTAQRRGFEDVNLLAIDVMEPKRKLSDHIYFKQWSDVYSWFMKESQKSLWAQRMVNYMEAAENRMTADGYLKEGTLTVFSGVPFNENNPYNYQEAKRVLRLAMEQLRGRRDLQKKLGMDPGGQGRPAITGKDRTSVWDFLPLRHAKGSSFTSFPHLTLSIHQDRIVVIVIVPSSMKSEFRRNLLKGGKEKFIELFREIQKNLGYTLKKIESATPLVELMQRHYLSQRSNPIIDAKLAFDLRTSFNVNKRGGHKEPSVKVQPLWLDSVYQVFSKKKANLQLSVGAVFPYNHCRVVNTPQIIDHITNVWLACKPLIKKMID